MSKLIYPNPIELDGKVIVSSEVLTHYRCPHCNLFSNASDLLPDELTVYCHKCGGRVELPKGRQLAWIGETIIRPEFPIDWTEYSDESDFAATDWAGSETDAGMPQRGVK